MFFSTVDWQSIANHITEATGQSFTIKNQSSIGGGCINTTYRLEGEGRLYFAKLNQHSYLDMFEAEAEGLQTLAKPQVIKVPDVICTGSCQNYSYLVLEFIDMGGGGNLAHTQLGHQLAALHQVTHSQFGWHRDNYIGSTPQINKQENDWVTFWQEHRLYFQLELASNHGHHGKLQQDGERLLADLGYFFTDYRPQPSLLHGDLWSGNYSINIQGQPVIYDPAVYFGDREADIAMTELFGGFSQNFYAAYQDHMPLDVGYKVRKNLYNLYHILNHLNLFGSGYRNQAERMVSTLLSEIR